MNVLRLVDADRVHGHRHTLLDPLGLQNRARVASLDISYHQLISVDLDTRFKTGSLFF